MNPAEYARMFQNEDHYWWFVSRRELVTEMIGRYVTAPNAVIVDVGCGTGATARALGRFGRVVGVDFSPLAMEACASRGLSELLRARAEAIPLASGSIDGVVATDIIEHLDDDLAALAEFRRILKPGGHAVITVPAYQFLWSEHDLALMHRRRYVASQIGELADRAGFRRIRLGYALSFLFPLALGRLLKRQSGTNGRPPEAQIKPVPGWINSALIRVQRLETALFRHGSLPWGLSVVTVLQNPVPQSNGPGRG
jgi:SAM-dependent methyltransferase